MPGLSASIRHAAILAMALISPGLTLADDPTPPKSEARKAEEAIRPLPPVAIPDDPPPHEGAMIDTPYTIEPPDIIVVEVLEGLPGLPITGERLVRRDGTISLGFYGDVHVRGLTTQQAKVKIIHHLQNHLNDEVLGLLIFEREHEAEPVLIGRDPQLPPEPDRPKRNPFDLDPPPGEAPPKGAPKAKTDPNAKLDDSGQDRQKLSQHPTSSARADRRSTKRPPARDIQARRPRRRGRQLVPAPDQDPKPVQPDAEPGEMKGEKEVAGHFVPVDPLESTRVFVDVSSYNSKNYYVQGNVGVPGRLPCTGKDTVLDALNYAGGLLATSEPNDIHLYRPAQGGKPSKDHRIDMSAIIMGDAGANLQLFPNDRLYVGRNPIVKKAADLDRVAAPINSVLNTILQYSFSARSLATVGLPPSGASEIRAGGASVPTPATDPAALTAARRDAMMKEWVDFLWDLSEKEAGKTLDEQALREALLKKLTTPPATEPRK
jgi:protein involved in polysaccharide export with SLBB domain